MGGNVSMIDGHIDECTTTLTAKIGDAKVRIGTPCLICGETSDLPRGIYDGPKICDKCRAAVMKVRKAMEDPYKEILDAQTIEVHEPAPKAQTDLNGKCGGCFYSKQATNVFGKSKSYVECTNAAHLAKIKGRSSSLAHVRQRTCKACKEYKRRENHG